MAKERIFYLRTDKEINEFLRIGAARRDMPYTDYIRFLIDKGLQEERKKIEIDKDKKYDKMNADAFSCDFKYRFPNIIVARNNNDGRKYIYECKGEYIEKLRGIDFYERDGENILGG